MDESTEFNTLYLPDLNRYVVAVFAAKPGELGVGAGVLVKVGDRHFVATAAHCIKDRPQVMTCTATVNTTSPVEMRRLQVLGTGWHSDSNLDIGYLEIEDPHGQELSWPQLSTGPVGTPVHVVGFPATHLKVDHEQEVITLGLNAFQTGLIEASEESLKFGYPKRGSSYDAATNTWVPCSFPATPKGFSGGGCFCVYKNRVGPLDVIEYRLHGIQCSWKGEGRRYVKAVPIKQWCDLLISRGHTP